jgi:hypothetical protein
MALAGVVAEGDEAEAAGGLTGYQGEGFCIRQQAGEVGAGLVKAAGQGIAQRGLGKKAQTDELPADDLRVRVCSRRAMWSWSLIRPRAMSVWPMG